MRINALGNTATDFASDDYIAIDGTTNGSRKMKNDSLLKVTAQNALADNVAQAFDDTRDNTNPYKAGESVVYTDGKVYTFKVDHYGAWNAADVYTDNIINATLRYVENGTDYYFVKSSLSLHVDSSFNVVSGWKACIIPVPQGMNHIELYNPTENTYSYRVYYLNSSSVTIGNAAPVVYPIENLIDAGNNAKLLIPNNCTYILVTVYQDIPVYYRFRQEKDVVNVFTLENKEIKSNGTIGTQSNQKLFIIETKGLDCPFIEFSNFTNNYFKSAFSTDNDFPINTAINIYSGSELGTKFICNDSSAKLQMPIPNGVNYVILSSYYTASFKVTKCNEKKNDKQIAFNKRVDVGSTEQVFCPLASFGDNIIIRATSTYDALLGDIRLGKIQPSEAFTNIGYMSYGRFYTQVKEPLSSQYRISFGSSDANTGVTYRIEVGTQKDYKDKKFSFAVINAGCFDHGKSTSPTTLPADGPEFVENWIDLLKEMSADVVAFCEWNTTMTTGNDFPSKRKLLNNYPCVQEYVASGGYTKKSIASIYDASKIETKIFDNLDGAVIRCVSYCKINVFGEEVILAVTHLDMTDAVRMLQIGELVTLFDNDKRVIISGDFNVDSLSEYQPFTEAGYDMANGDIWGETFTYVGNDSSPAANLPLDNIIVKGLKLKNPRFPFNKDATDHKAVVADVYFI